MSLTRAVIQGISNRQIKKIVKAKEACADAGQTLFGPEGEVSENWKGEAGSAMAQELHEVWEQIKEAHSLLAAAETSVRARASYIVNNWTEDEEGE